MQINSLPLPAPDIAQTDRQLRDAAHGLEATFLAQMLKSAGMGQSRQAMGGGAGEDQFSSFLLEAQAKKMVEQGGIGLAEAIFESLKASRHDG